MNVFVFFTHPMLAAGGLPDLGSLLKWGQMGLALAMAILGYHLHNKAIESRGDVAARTSAARQFMFFALALFIISFAGEMAVKFLKAQDSTVNTTLFTLPLHPSNFAKYGDNKVMWREGTEDKTASASSLGVDITLTDHSQIKIDLTPFTTAYSEMERLKQSLESQFAHNNPDIGVGE